MKTKKLFKSAPLPFQGQKRRFAGDFTLALSELKTQKRIDIIVDLFGGSGLLAHTAKHIFPESLVIYNDFDNYSKRLLNIDQTNCLLQKIRDLTISCEKDKLIPEYIKRVIVDIIRKEDSVRYVDYITLSSSLMFSGKYVISIADLEKETFYNNVKHTNYNFNPEEYLQGLEITHSDYRDLYVKYKDLPNVLFIIDPPYLSTDTTTYNSDKYWKLRDYLDVLNVLSGTNYFFFTSNKSSLIELCEWFAENRTLGNPFENSVLNTKNVTINKTSGYTDMMLYKFIK